jgi:rSAM/selenodomain-associated transferase 2
VPQLGIVVPTLNEEQYLATLLESVRSLSISTDVVVADGGSGDETGTVAERMGARVIRCEPGRARQMNAGAEAALGDWLCFLHADVQLPAAARDDLVRTVTADADDAAVWRLAIDAKGTWFRVLEFGARLRDRLGGLPYGDQGLLVRRRVFEDVGGFPDIPLMEDVAMVRILRRRGRLLRLSSSVVVSARRWQREGALRGWLRNVCLMSAYLLGVDPYRLARWYRPEPGNR